MPKNRRKELENQVLKTKVKQAEDLTVKTVDIKILTSHQTRGKMLILNGILILKSQF